MHSRRLSSLLAAAVFLGTATPALAAFSDVPSSHLFREPIDALSALGVIKGNPDGTFAPSKAVNRAELLTMLYRAMDKSPTSGKAACFVDVVTDSWYEAVVCDAAAKGYVGGYADGNFRPAQNVNRVEALKMITTVFGLNVDSSLHASLGAYFDIERSAWYAPYVSSAFSKEILPVAGMSTTRFGPAEALSRAEAAAYIYNAIHPTSSDSSSSKSTGSVSSASLQEGEIALVFPFVTEGEFNDKKPTVIRFPIDETRVTSFRVTVNKGSVTCRLYLLGDDGFSEQYFLGFEEDGTCEVRATVVGGDYQFQVQPSFPDAIYDIVSEVVPGDANDGFDDAVRLGFDQKKMGTLESGDLQDFYSLSLASEMTLNIDFVTSENLRCIVYAMDDVDWYQFEGPECNMMTKFVPGTYFISIGRAAPKDAKQTYALTVEKR